VDAPVVSGIDGPCFLGRRSEIGKTLTGAHLSWAHLTLDTAKRVRELLRRSGFCVVMMREGDYFIELDERVARANKEGSQAILGQPAFVPESGVMAHPISPKLQLISGHTEEKSLAISR
jgi:hypothetical protein